MDADSYRNTEPVSESTCVTSQSRDLHPPPAYTALNGLTAATQSTAPLTPPPPYEPDPCTFSLSQYPPLQPAAALPASTSVGAEMLPYDGQQQQQPATDVRINSQTVDCCHLYHQSIVLGTTLIAIGTLSAIFNIVDLTMNTQLPNDYNDPFATACHGLWAGALCFVTGSVAVAAGITKRRRTITAGTLMSLLTSVVCAIELSLAAAAAVAMEQYVAFCKDFSTPAEPIRNSCLKCRLWMTTLAPHVATDICSKVGPVYAMEIMMVIMGALAVVIAGYASAVLKLARKRQLQS